MRVAVIADIHGNIDALRAVLADIDRLGIRAIVNLGDHLGGPLAAAETADLLMSRDMVCIRGNHDREMVETPRDRMGQSDRAAVSQVEQRHLDWLAAMPATAVSGQLFLCHGRPDSDVDPWLETLSADGQVCLAPIEEIEARASGLDHPVLLCGHTHLQRIVRLRDGRIVVNPGSVGLPAYEHDYPAFHVVQSGSPDARYAILEKRDGGWRVEHRAIPYDTSRMVSLARAANRPDWVSALATGWIR